MDIIFPHAFLEHLLLSVGHSKVRNYEATWTGVVKESQVPLTSHLAFLTGTIPRIPG